MALLSIFSTENSFKVEYAISCSVYEHRFYSDMCAGRIVLGLETNGMVVSFLPQLLDRVSACE